MENVKWRLNDAQIESITKAIWKYTAPLLLVFLVQVQSGQPLQQALFTVYGAALQLAINILSKLISETK